MTTLIVQNRRGHQSLTVDPASTSKDAQDAVADAERIMRVARENGCSIYKMEQGESKLVIDHSFDKAYKIDPSVSEYHVLAPISGG